MDAMNELKTKIEKSINYFEENLTSIRVGKASAGVLDRIMVNYYGCLLYTSPSPRDEQ